MNLQQNHELNRNGILVLLSEVSSAGLTFEMLHSRLYSAGCPMLLRELITYLDFLEEKAYVNTSRATMAKGVKRYSLSAEGREYLETKGLA